MSDIKTFLFLDEKTGDILMAKRSRSFDYNLKIPGVSVESRQFHGQLPTPKTGYARFMRKKLEALIFLRTMSETMCEQVEKSFAKDRVESVTLSADSQTRYQAMMNEERDLALRKIQKFFDQKHREIVDCSTETEIAQKIRNLSERVNLGVYSATNQERKSLDGF